ncbi:hypothetical protein [Aeromonas salmonicida]|uniref:hypothetical protein n=1 Tax=Aeromonas salmonicida TaxID=645 RepID=UPI000D8634BD|nr:hypothetical protein [Aeromonas salmonicida]SPT72519.1 Uncharacterised protein [Aeromonas salmonicida]
MSQTSSQADDAMKKLNLGPKPDIIDNTKANLDKLRKVERGVVKSWWIASSRRPTPKCSMRWPHQVRRASGRHYRRG